MRISEIINESVKEGSLNELAPSPGFGGDKRSKLLASVGRLLDSGNKVDWQVSGQMGHVTRVQNDGITMKRWKMPRSRMTFFLPMYDDSRDSKYAIKMVSPKHYAVVSAEKGLSEGLDEAVGGNYLYHATSADGLKGMLSSGSISQAKGPQKATQAQTAAPTVSVTRDWGYASGSTATQQSFGGIGRDVVIVLDRNAIESNFKTLGTSQSHDIRGLPRANEPELAGRLKMRAIAMKQPELKGQNKMNFGTAKAGGEFEEAVVVPKGALPLRGTMVGFWVNPKSELMKDPAIMNDPRRLDMVRPNQFVKASQPQSVAETELDEAKKRKRKAKSKRRSASSNRSPVPTRYYGAWGFGDFEGGEGGVE
jgi:hypothetical protein